MLNTSQILIELIRIRTGNGTWCFPQDRGRLFSSAPTGRVWSPQFLQRCNSRTKCRCIDEQPAKVLIVILVVIIIVVGLLMVNSMDTS